MKTRDEIKENIIKNSETRIQIASSRIGNSSLSDKEKSALETIISKCNSELYNIDEVTNIEIGSATNGIIVAFENKYPKPSDKNIQNFVSFVQHSILSESKSLAQRCSHILGLDEEDLRDFSINCGDIANSFRLYINLKLGTNIPMEDDFLEAVHKYKNSCSRMNYRDYQLWEDYLKARNNGDNCSENIYPRTNIIDWLKAYVKLKTLARDSGSIKDSCGFYNPLGADTSYQAAEEIIKKPEMSQNVVFTHT